ncbi:subtilisin-like protein [Trichoderma reesei RUT C-30]|uniref:Subtilisin-like protein n=1 Tax=Hypocrea jecorina (strain ATCC 56765 / BCRC 32924 / NRRL 11460 / Rut C-30) TaxID=1344414 RepID=A0A024SH38_HYPJR|nr:subtilisin-like protein [Trichoderma reesei RUT C-30]
MHRYPRVLALGILLVEIGIGSPRNRIQDSSSSRPDDDWLWALNRCSNRQEWGTFDIPEYLKAAKSCLDPQHFFSASECDGDAPGLMDGLRHRKSVLYQRVVAPLEKVLVSTGWMEELTETEPVNASIEKNRPTINGVHFSQSRATKIQGHSQLTAEFCFTKDQRDAKKWFKEMKELGTSLSQPRGSRAGIRIAILDTGCNIDSAFFGVPPIQCRLKGWKDFVSGATHWQDHHGHGTYLASLILQIASMADIYVARVASSSDDLAKASDKVAEAISWASKECNADIISMSFGFADDHPCITKAIHEALSHRNGSILFFAAASNYGANEKELFPARHESVISIRATNSKGQFLDLNNPPRSQHDGVVFGTLGLDVPSEPLVSGEIQYKTGTSVATAIAASIAGALLQFALGDSQREEFEQVQTSLRTRKGMQALFEHLAVASHYERYLYLAPWTLCKQTDSARWSTFVAAVLR